MSAFLASFEATGEAVNSSFLFEVSWNEDM